MYGVPDDRVAGDPVRNDGVGIWRQLLAGQQLVGWQEAGREPDGIRPLLAGRDGHLLGLDLSVGQCLQRAVLGQRNTGGR